MTRSYQEALESSRTAYNAGRKIYTKSGAKAALNADQVKPFVVIVNRTIEYAGSTREAARLLGIKSDATLHQLLRYGQLTVGTGHKILAGYKQIKHHM